MVVVVVVDVDVVDVDVVDVVVVVVVRDLINIINLKYRIKYKIK